MQFKCAKVKYIHCHISLYSKKNSENFKQKTKATNTSFYFLLKHQFLEFFIKAEFKSTNFVRTDSLLFVGFDVVIFLLSLSHSRNKSQDRVPINDTDYRWSQI